MRDLRVELTSRDTHVGTGFHTKDYGTLEVLCGAG